MPDPASGKIEALLDRPHDERFEGLNNLVFAKNGDLYFTDQGESGLHGIQEMQPRNELSP